MKRLKELFRSLAGVRVGSPGEGKATEEILTGNDVASLASLHLLYGIETDTMTGVFRPEQLGFSDNRLVVHRLRSPCAGDADRSAAQTSQVFHQSTDGAWSRTDELMSDTELEEERIELLFTQIGVCITQSSQFLDHRSLPEPLPFLFWYFGIWIQVLELAGTSTKTPLPVIECSA